MADTLTKNDKGDISLSAYAAEAAKIKALSDKVFGNYLSLIENPSSSIEAAKISVVEYSNKIIAALEAGPENFNKKSGIAKLDNYHAITGAGQILSAVGKILSDSKDPYAQAAAKALNDYAQSYKQSPALIAAAMEYQPKQPASQPIKQ